LEENDAEQTDLLQMLSGELLARFIELLPEIKDFLRLSD